MRWVFLLGLMALVPAMVGWLQQNPNKRPLVAMAMGLLPFVLAPWHLYVAPYGWPAWAGHTKGLEVSLLDAIALAVLISAPRSRFKLPFKAVFFTYLACVLVSIGMARMPTASLFYLWQVLRMVVVFAAVVKLCEHERAPAALMTGLILGIGTQAYYAISGFLGGAVESGGTFGHRNLLGLVTHFVLLPSLALVLAGERGWAPKTGVLLSTIVVILTSSRATIGLAGPACFVLLVLSMIRKNSSRKAAIVTGACIALAVAAPLALASLDKRFERTGAADESERIAFESAAKMMVAENPLGVGANNYVFVANGEGYSSRAGVHWGFGSRSTSVHNAYLLVAAETGYVGLIAFCLLLLLAIKMAFQTAWRYRNDRRGELSLGLGMALLVVAIHSKFEWAALVFSVQYLLACNLGLIAGLANQLARDARKRPGQRADAVAAPRDAEPLGGAMPRPGTSSVAPETIPKLARERRS